MLPFLLKKKHDVGVIVKERSPDENSENKSEFDELEECAKDLISAIERKDHRAVADALHAAFSVCSEEPQESQPEPHSYDASKEE